ncbi:MAG: ABC transporter ATP-binding protein [Alphaproteobacteria bacterium]|nr:ABC transporter ATP-binding protein [Alphaproteobacteria bacterium]
MAANPVSIRLVGISARFDHRVKGEVAAVDDVSLEVAPGELLTLLGPSGCGKTTTLRMIAGFQRPSAGRILIGDHDVTEVLSNDRNIGFVFQNYALFPHLGIFENVAYGLRVRRMDEAAIRRVVGDVLELVGLKGYERQMPHQLSGGEQQRVALARAIVIKPRVLLFDEPLSNLDAKLRVQMRGEIQRLQRDVGITTVYVTHDQEEAMAISDRIAVMSKGVIAQLGRAEDLYSRPASEFVARFIGRANLLRTTVLARDGARLTLGMAGQRYVVDAPESGPPVGAVAHAVIRPETILIGPADAVGAIPGRVVTRTYLGEKTEYTVTVGADTLQIVRIGAAETERFEPGAAVGIRLPAGRLHLLPEVGT